MPSAARIPPGPGARPPLDELRALRRGPHEFFLRIAGAYGPVVRYPAGPFKLYLITGPEGVKHVLQDNHRNYSKDTFQYNLLSTITGQGLLTSDGEHWLRQRRLSQPAFHKPRLAGFAPGMVAAAQEMLARWDLAAERGEPLDAAAQMMHVALQIVSQAMFSVKIGDEADDLARATLTVLDHIVDRAKTLGVSPEWLPTRRNRAHRQALTRLDRTVYETIGKRRRSGGGPGEEHGAPDLLALLMAARDERGEAMTDRQLRDEAMTVLIAGHETVASALAWTWHLLAENPLAEQLLHHELDRELGGSTPTFADLPRLRYTEMVFLEALRLYPPAWIISRKSLDADEISGYRVPAGALVISCPYATHRQPDLWPEPESFRPERFGEAESAGRHRFAFYPFGGGPRLCIGNTFAMTEAMLILASVAQRYTLRPVPGQRVEVEAGVTLRPRYGLMMNLARRTVE